MRHLSDAWSRFWSLPVFWTAVPIYGVISFAATGFIFMFAYQGATSGVFMGYLLLLLASVMALSGMTGVCGQATARRAATWKDLAQGVRQYFWRTLGLLGIWALASLALALVLLLTLLPFIGLAFESGQPLNSGTLAARIDVAAVGLAGGILVSALPAMFFNDAGPWHAVRLGVGFLRRRLGVVCSLLVVGVVGVQGIGFLTGSLLQNQPLEGAFFLGLFGCIASAAVGALILLALFLAYFADQEDLRGRTLSPNVLDVPSSGGC